MKKKAAARIALMALILAMTGAAAAFADVDFSQWNSQVIYPQDVINTHYFLSVKALTDNKVITGDADGLFHAERNITRAEFAVMMARATNQAGKAVELQQEEIFQDLAGYTWARGSINACYRAGLLQGVGGSSFAPANPVTYQEVVTMIARFRGPNAEAEIAQYGAWPRNIITYAQLYNMPGPVAITDWAAPATRGDVALLMYRNMSTLKPS